MAVVQRVLLSVCSALDRRCLSEPVYSPNPWHDFPWDPVCSVCPVVACSFQLSECSTDIPESSGSPSSPPLGLGHWGKKQTPPSSGHLPKREYFKCQVWPESKDPSFEYRVIQLQMILPKQSSCRWQRSFEHPVGACFFPVFQAQL